MKLAEVSVFLLRTHVDSTREQDRIAWHARARMVGACNSGVKRAEISTKRVGANDWLDIVITIARLK